MSSLWWATILLTRLCVCSVNNRILFTRIIPITPLIIIAVLFISFQYPDSPEAEISPSIESISSKWEVSFSAPQDPSAATYRHGPEAALVESIDAAQFSVDVAIYHLNLWSVRDALIRAQNRGVEVRLVVDDTHVDELEIDALERAGIPIMTDQSRQLMHHKFVVVDRIEVWTGSMNLTLNGAYLNDNNLLRIRSRDMAHNFTREFEEMFIQKRFGAFSISDTPYPQLEIEGRFVETYFSPDDGVVHRIVDLLSAAKERVELLAFTLTSDLISDALRNAHRRNVEIRGVVETSQMGSMGSDVVDLIAGGMDIRLDGNSNLMHHKVIIIDSNIVILGSYNFTRSAEDKNDENTIIVHDPAFAGQFLIEFDRLYEQAQP